MSDEQIEDKVELGKSGLYVSPMGTGAWAWGDRFFWGYGGGYSDEDVRSAFEASLEAGIDFFDTAEVYGNGKSERYFSRFCPGGAAPDGKKLVLATKFFPFPWRIWKGALRIALRRSLKRMNLESVDLYQVHFPLPPVSIESWAEALGEAVQDGLVRAVGVSNYNFDQMRRAHETLAGLGVPLASNQVEYSLLDRKVEREGLLNACHELGVTLIAYSPLAKGALTGKYTPENPPGGFRSRQYNREKLGRIQPLLQLMCDIGHAYGSRTPAQVALNWTMCKGTLPIPGAKNARQAQENSGALGWRLKDIDVAALDEASEALG